MASKATNAALIAACSAMLTEGIGYGDMDCQAAVEAALVRAGLARSMVNLAGSNAHYRNCLWTGTPQRLCDLLGVKKVPAGVFVFIVLASGEPAKYQGDGMGNADHIGIYLGNGKTFHSSQTNGGVCVSTKFDGYNIVPNGGWNMVGLSGWVDCGLSAAQLAALKADANYAGEEAEISGTNAAAAEAAAVDVSGFYTIKRGCKGGAVQRLQEWLNTLGYSLAVDHDFGAQTQAAVTDFQTKQGLEADGVAGQKTWAALAAARTTVNAAEQG